MGSTRATEEASQARRGVPRAPWVVVTCVLSFCLGAALVGIGAYLFFARPSPWEAVSVVLLGTGMLLISLGAWREARGAPPRRMLRVAVYAVMLAAVLVHFLLV